MKIGIGLETGELQFLSADEIKTGLDNVATTSFGPRAETASIFFFKSSSESTSSEKKAMSVWGVLDGIVLMHLGSVEKRAVSLGTVPISAPVLPLPARWWIPWGPGTASSPVFFSHISAGNVFPPA